MVCYFYLDWVYVFVNLTIKEEDVRIKYSKESRGSLAWPPCMYPNQGTENQQFIHDPVSLAPNCKRKRDPLCCMMNWTVRLGEAKAVTTASHYDGKVGGVTTPPVVHLKITVMGYPTMVLLIQSTAYIYD